MSVKDAVLKLLREQAGAYLSGEEVAARLQVSRTAIWKQIAALRAEGYEIESSPRLGYRLLSEPDSVTPAAVQRGLSTRSLGRLIEYLPRVTSTNEVAKEQARAGAPEGLVVLAEEQTGGKGRLGRSWVSPPGVGLWMTAVLRPPLPPVEVPRLTLVAAAAVAAAIRSAAGLPVGIKWPNDIVHRDRKLCGILTEMEADMERVHFAVVGIGINANLPAEAFPPDLAEVATSLRLEVGRPVDRAALARAVLQELERGYDALLSGRFATEVLPRWRQYTVTLGRQVRVTPVAPGQPTLTGLARDVAEDGALILELPDGRLERVVAGEVSLRPVPGR